MTKIELITKWKKELLAIQAQIESLRRSHFHVSQKLTTRRKIILSFLEDIRQLDEAERN